MSSTTPDYRPGDVVNGHVLTPQGTWQPVGAPPPHAQPVGAASPQEPKRKRHWVRNTVIGVIAFFVIAGVASAIGDDSDQPADKPAASAPASTEPKAQEPAEQPAVEEQPAQAPQPEMTLAQENAVDSAEDYLDYSAFSKKGLIEQLSSEYGDGYSRKDAIFAVNHIDVDWNEQAAMSAKQYLEYDSFSRQGLIDQLESPYGEQFTHAQAVYGVNRAGL